MVTGLVRFREHFEDFSDRYLIIGGTACELALTEAGLPFRATRDIDIVLCLEAVDVAFARAFWDFVQSGRYESLEAPGDRRHFYRFRKPRTDGYPAMLELFSRMPELLGDDFRGHLIPIPISDEVSSLSAILLDPDYEGWARAGRTMIQALPLVRPEHLIPLKARAWLDLTRRSAEGQPVDRKDIRKHRNDVFRLYAVIDPEYHVQPPASIRADMTRFIEAMHRESIDLKAMGLRGMQLESVLDALSMRFGVAPS
ncbi:MAG: hypothetical protein KDA21_11235 [Phycisphaerales bacterium]|nr:hypothetical protein [Phycisphaerales bacterium]